MDERLGLSLTQRQQTTLAPMQLQFVRMLEMNGAEAEDEVGRMLDDNPALEVADEPGEDLQQIEFGETAEQLQRADYSSDEEVPSYRLGVNNRSWDDPVYEPTATTGGESLFEYLMSQLAEDSELSERSVMVARHVVGNIDANGYMERTVGAIADDLAIQEGVDVSDEEVRRVWQRVRELEPAGVGAVDLRDSLLLQLQRREPTEAVKLATEIVEHYFDLFSLMHFDRLASATGADRTQMQQAMETIRSLNPKPGALISGDDDERTRQITPDFYVEPDGEDRLTLQMVNQLPQLRIEQSFAADSKVERRSTAAAEAANAFIRQKRDEAQTFIRVLEMRNRTLFRVVSAIVQWQREFFLTGDRVTLRPMVLKDISKLTGDDLSVVSRATTGKYIASPYGVYSLKSLFNEPRHDAEDARSTAEVMERLKEIIESEDKSKPLSDAEITARLNDEGFDIARRTVAKYRERLGLPVGRLRKTL